MHFSLQFYEFYQMTCTLAVIQLLSPKTLTRQTILYYMMMLDKTAALKWFLI